MQDDKKMLSEVDYSLSALAREVERALRITKTPQGLRDVLAARVRERMRLAMAKQTEMLDE